MLQKYKYQNNSVLSSCGYQTSLYKNSLIFTLNCILVHLPKVQNTS